MKKVLLTVLIIILLGGCALGGWYYLTTSKSSNPMVGTKLQIENTAKIIWIDDDEAMRRGALGNRTEQEYITEYKEELYGDISFDKLSFLKDGVVECHKKGAQTSVTAYYLTNPTCTTIRLYADKDCNEVCDMTESPYSGFSLIFKDEQGHYWLLMQNLPHDYKNRGYVVFKFNVAK